MVNRHCALVEYLYYSKVVIVEMTKKNNTDYIKISQVALLSLIISVRLQSTSINFCVRTI